MLPSATHCFLGGNTAADASGDVGRTRFKPNRTATDLDLFIETADITEVVLRPVFRKPRAAGQDAEAYAATDVQYTDAAADITVSADGGVRKRISVTPGMEVGLRVQSFTGGAGKTVKAFGVFVDRQ
jgi:hypothetical protein